MVPTELEIKSTDLRARTTRWRGVRVHPPEDPMALNGASSDAAERQGVRSHGPGEDSPPTLPLPTDASESTWAPTGINQLLAEPDAAKVVLLMISLSAARACRDAIDIIQLLISQWPDRTPRANRVVEDLLDAMGRSAMATSFAGLGDQRNPAQSAALAEGPIIAYLAVADRPADSLAVARLRLPPLSSPSPRTLSKWRGEIGIRHEDDVSMGADDRVRLQRRGAAVWGQARGVLRSTGRVRGQLRLVLPVV